MINRYNGRKFRFEVYLNNVLSTTPKFSNGKANEHITVSVPQPDGNGNMINKTFIFYYEETEEVNGLEVVVPVKKYEKKEFFRAIEEQLMYIPNIKFYYKKQDSFSAEEIDIAAKVVYKDDNIVISESTILDYPHILLGTGKGLVNYGKIDFTALELEPKKGAVGLILNINDVEVTPSREAVIWSAKTRAAIVTSYNKVVETATNLITKELDSCNDYWEWLQKVSTIKNSLASNNAATGSVLQKLSGVVDASSINKLYYRKDGMNKLFVSDVKEMIGEKLLIRSFRYDGYGKKIARDKIKNVNSISGFQTYITEGASDKYKDRYLYEYVEKRDFLVIKKLENWSLEMTSNLIGNSNKILSYDAIVVPEDVLNTYLSEELAGNVIADDESASLTPTIDADRLAKIRKLEEKILFHFPSPDMTFSSREVKISDIISNYSNDKIVYGLFSDRSLISRVFKMYPIKTLDFYSGQVSYPMHEFSDRYCEIININPINVMLVGQDSEKYIKRLNNFIHINDYLIESYKNEKLTFNKDFRKIMTFYVINKIINENNLSLPNFINENLNNFYTEEFLNSFIIAAITSQRNRYSGIPGFFKYCIEYEMNKDTLDDNTLKDYLTSINSYLPEELCEKLDEISDIHIIDIDLINKVKKYCEVFGPLAPIINIVRDSSSCNILSILHNLIKDNDIYKKED